ncbi:hypothetical protein ACFU8W_37640 [Streptomyces sp. NPDC057565]|uniref:hypothetical protein n=1 Tax=Streptomyces sp. NPDC057565 TaxID=3346169 RepID=UPI0036C392C0
MPEHAAAGREDTAVPELPVALDIPGKLADFLRAAELDDAGRAALDHGVTVRRSQGCARRVNATRAVHHALLDRSQRRVRPRDAG